MANKTYIWIKAEGNPDRSVTYSDKDGNKLTRYLDSKATNPPRGTKSWRHQNPGKVTHGDFSKRQGEIGFACYPNPDDPKKKLCFAIFPDYDTGKKAFATLMKTENYIDLTLNQFPRRYTGILKDGIPDTKAVVEYRNNLQKISKFDMDRKIRSFTGEEYERLLDAIQRCEGWYPGDEKLEPAPDKIIGVKFIKHKAAEFLIQTVNGSKKWLTLAQAIARAEAHQLFAVVVHGPHGIYLRPYPHQPRFHDIAVC